jgi:hypothetical protein
MSNRTDRNFLSPVVRDLERGAYFARSHPKRGENIFFIFPHFSTWTVLATSLGLVVGGPAFQKKERALDGLRISTSSGIF